MTAPKPMTTSCFSDEIRVLVIDYAPVVTGCSALGHVETALGQHFDSAVGDGTGIGRGARESPEWLIVEMSDQTVLVSGHALGKACNQKMR